MVPINFGLHLLPPAANSKPLDSLTILKLVFLTLLASGGVTTSPPF